MQCTATEMHAHTEQREPSPPPPFDKMLQPKGSRGRFKIFQEVHGMMEVLELKLAGTWPLACSLVGMFLERVGLELWTLYL